MAKSQKEAVVEAVLAELPSFEKHKDNALSMLSAAQLESIKTKVLNGILDGSVEYSKDISVLAEVRTYARSMVMNHLKKAKELTGGAPTPVKASNAERRLAPAVKSSPKVPKGVDEELLPEYMKEYVSSLM